MKLVFATQNLNKLKEVQALMPQGIELLSLAQIGCHAELPETRDSIEGNAIQKAEFVYENFGFNCFADDTGLEVFALNGEPGVYSARYAGVEADADANMEKLLNALWHEDNRKAQFITVIALIINGELRKFSGICKGEILISRQGEKGFGYDPIFKPEGFDLSFAQMDLKDKNNISHRGRSIRQLVEFLGNLL